MLRRAALVLLGLGVAVGVPLGATFLPAHLDLADLPEDLVLPAASPPDGLAVYALTTANVGSTAMFAYRGGSPNEPRPFAMTAFLVEHPRGNILIDAGTASDGEAHFEEQSILMTALSEYEPGRSASDQLLEAGIATSALTIIPTHAHWDHVSGVADLPGVPVWLPAAEADAISGAADGTEVARAVVDPKQIRRYAFDDGPYLGYHHSHDVYGDGSVVLVPAPGHTVGSVVVFVALPVGARYAFIGDIVWQREGITKPAERPWIARWLVDHDDDAVRDQIAHLAALDRRFPQLVIIPAHDARAAAELPPLAERAARD